MSDQKASAKFRAPKVRINRVYTKTGDQGESRLVGGQRVQKDAARLEAYGTVDELSAFVGVARAQLVSHGAAPGGSALLALDAELIGVQHTLFNLGSLLATLDKDLRAEQARVTDADVTRLEKSIDRWGALLPPLTSFILAGSSPLSAAFHVARTVCRRAERRTVSLARQEALDHVAIRYLNRLSDALFVWGRAVDHALHREELLWDPNLARV